MRHEIQWTIMGQRYGKTFKTREAALEAFHNERLSDRVTRVELISPQLHGRLTVEDAESVLYLDMQREG